MRVAAIDLGTNTLRLLVGELGGVGGFRPVFAAQEITRLGQGLLPERELQPEPIRRNLAALLRFRVVAESHGASEVTVVGTSALREAKNREMFLARARRETGLEVRVISGEEEARLTLLGVRAGLGVARGRLLLMDIGGGSTEFVLAEGSEILATVSTGLGAVKLTEAYVKNDPPSAGDLDQVRGVVAGRVARVRAQELPGLGHGEILVGTAGTVTSLAALDLQLDPYDPERVNGHCLTRERVEGLIRELARLPLARRRKLPGLEPGRADVIVAGAVVCLTAMDSLGFTDITVSEGGLREGILLDRLARLVTGSHGAGRGEPGGR